MTIELRQTTTVQPGGLVTLYFNALPIGTTVDVIVRFEPEASLLAETLASFIGAAKGNFVNPEAVDQFIRQEREAWDF